MPLTQGYRLSHDPAELQLDVIHAYLSRSYWSPGIPFHAVERAVAHSLTVAVFDPTGAQVGFARMVTDQASFGYLSDVFVLEALRGRGLARAMVRALLDRPEIRDCRTLMLLTQDAHGVYEACGYQRVQDPGPFMQILRPGHYPQAPAGAAEPARPEAAD
jgi:GNAT superfamily N-acetyltransferase